MALSQSPIARMERGLKPQSVEDVAYAFAGTDRGEVSGRCSASIASSGDTRMMLSYATPVAIQDGTGRFAVSARTYSSTTTRHVSYIRSALARWHGRPDPYYLVDGSRAAGRGWNSGCEPWQLVRQDAPEPHAPVWVERAYDIVPITDESGTYSHVVRNHGYPVAYVGPGTEYLRSVYTLSSQTLPQYVHRAIDAVLSGFSIAAHSFRMYRHAGESYVTRDDGMQSGRLTLAQSAMIARNPVSIVLVTFGPDNAAPPSGAVLAMVYQDGNAEYFPEAWEVTPEAPLYKVTAWDGSSIYASTGTYPVDEWTPWETPRLCASGWHVCDDPDAWVRGRNNLIYRVRVAGAPIGRLAIDNKQSYPSIMLVSPPVTLEQWQDARHRNVDPWEPVAGTGVTQG